MSPREVGRTSLWEFMCAYAGWMKSQGGETEREAPSDEDHEALIKVFKDMEAKEMKNEQ